jgi:hypothetical protein
LKKLLVVSIVTLGLATPAAQSADAPFQLIADPRVSGTTVSREVIIAGIFLKKVQRWGDVIGYVAGHPGGIGYVAAGTPLPPSVKVLKVL